MREWSAKLIDFFFQDVNASLEQVIFTDWYFCAETKFNYFAIFFCMKLEQSLNSKLNIKTAVCEVAKSLCKYFICPSSLTYFLWQE